MMGVKLVVRRLGRYWWITGDEEDGPYGPFETKKEALESRRDLNRTMKDVDFSDCHWPWEDEK